MIVLSLFVGLVAGMLFRHMLWQFVCLLSHGWFGGCVVEWLGAKIAAMKQETMQSFAIQSRGKAKEVERPEVFLALADCFERIARSFDR